jgi:hypothetical protein
VRSSDRVEIAIPIQVIAEDLTTGRTFFRDCQTSVVSRHGATVVLSCVLAVDQEITLRCMATKAEVRARVVGVIQGKSKDPTYGLALLEGEPNPWGIEFPALSAVDDGFVRLLLVCEGCGRSEVVHLNEIEVEIFASNHSLRRPCPSCHGVRLWTHDAEGSTKPKETAGNGATSTNETTSKKERTPAISPAREPASAATSQIPFANRRKDRRVKTAITACIRRAAFNEEIVTCEDVSRGGIRFRTQKEYLLNVRIEVAVPCTPRAGNIYVPARVAHVRRVGEFFVVGVAFLPDGGLRASEGNAVV